MTNLAGDPKRKNGIRLLGEVVYIQVPRVRYRGVAIRVTEHVRRNRICHERNGMIEKE